PDLLQLPECPERGRGAQCELVRDARHVSGSLGLVSRSLGLLALGAMLVLAGCQRAPATPAAEHAPAVTDLDEAEQALAVPNWGAAAPHLRAALQQDPDSLFLHSSLAICASWLNLTDEADREFQWVRDHAPSDSEEAATARRWLVKRGESAETEANSTAA